MEADRARGPMWDVNTEIPDLTGKVAIVTGANTPIGVGFHTALQLAINGAKVYVGARSLQKAQDAIDIMAKTTGKHGPLILRPLAMDLGDLKAVKSAAQKLLSEESRLDILVNNAAVLARPLDKNEYGISVSFTINHIGPFLFTSELLPLLEKTAKAYSDVRIINLTSVTHRFITPGIKLDSIESFNQDMGGVDGLQHNLARYGLSKLATILFSKELQRRFDAGNVSAISIAVNPGEVKTNGAIQFVGGEANMHLLEGTLSPAEGALTSLFAATNPVVLEKKSEYAGGYLRPFGLFNDPSEVACDVKLGQELWKASETVIADILQ